MESDKTSGNNRLFNCSFQFKNATQAWESLYNTLASQHLKDYSRDGTIVGEMINTTTIIDDPTRCIITSPIRKMPMRYAVGELLWYLSGSNRLTDISKFSKSWDNLSDDGKTVNSAYGYRIFSKFGFDQWKWVEQELLNNPNSRRAVIHIKDADCKPTKDMPCTCLLQFFIRDCKLYMTTYMRSNDIWLGFPYDVFSFCCMQIKMAMELGLGIGTYTHFTGSLHLYERNLKPEYNYYTGVAKNATEHRDAQPKEDNWEGVNDLCPTKN